MIDFDKWQEIFESLNRHRMRTLLTAFGVFWGIFMLVLLLGAGKGLENGINWQFADEALSSIWLRPGRTSVPYKGLKEGRQIRFDNSDYEFIKTEFKDVNHITGRFFLSGDKQVRYGNTVVSFSIQCINPDFQVVENIIVTKGRFLTNQDVEEYNKVCVIGRIVKEKLFGEEDAIGKQVIVDGVAYKVVGTFYDTGGEWIMKNIYIPISTAQKVYSGQRRLHRIMFTADGLSTPELIALENEVRAAFAKRKNFDINDRRAFRSNNNAEDYESFASMIMVINGIVWMVGIFSIIAGVIGVSNIMLIIVKDRTREIGIRKAIGANPRSIVSMILQESIFITGVAGYIGMAAGVGVLALLQDVTTEFWRQPEVSLSVIATATLVLVIAGALAGLIPAVQAAKIHPVVAMKSD